MVQEPDTIDGIIERISEIVEQSKRERSRSGYFAALYRKVTLEVKQGIEDGTFDDGERMERLDVLFACRYLDAIEAYRGGGTPTRSWHFALEAGEQWWPIVLQHLLLGMNAHINLDLGIAAARSVSPAELPDLKNDFERINTVLASLVRGVQDELAQVWRTLRLLDRFVGNADDVLINFSMSKARDHAWSVAERLAPLDPAGQAREIERLDGEVLKLAHLVRHPGFVGSTVNRVIRLGERGTVPGIIDILS